MCCCCADRPQTRPANCAQCACPNPRILILLLVIFRAALYPNCSLAWSHCCLPEAASQCCLHTITSHKSAILFSEFSVILWIPKTFSPKKYKVWYPPWSLPSRGMIAWASLPLRWACQHNSWWCSLPVNRCNFGQTISRSLEKWKWYHTG